MIKNTIEIIKTIIILNKEGGHFELFWMPSW